jgi:hypothetical protein
LDETKEHRSLRSPASTISIFCAQADSRLPQSRDR